MKSNTLKRYFLIFLGAAIAAFGVSALYIPNKIVSGGLSGFATILYYLSGIQPGITFCVVNAILLILAWFILGKSFVANTITGAVIYTLLVQLFTYLPPLTNNIFLATVLGAILYGIGIGIVLISGATLGGTDILSRLLQHFFPQIKIGSLLAFVDGTVVFMSLIVFRNIDLALYGIIGLFLSGAAINELIRKLNVSRLLFVVTDYGEEISNKLISTSPRGVTIMNATGAYTHTTKKLLMCALKEEELAEFQKKVMKIDPEAFVIFSEAQQIVGNGFYVYR